MDEWVPGLLTDDEDVNHTLGPPSAREECFSCRRGYEDEAIPEMEKLNEWTQVWSKNLGQTDMIALAKEGEAKFDECIRNPANKHAARRGEREIPKYSASTQLDHFMNHTIDPRIELWKDINRIKQIESMIQKKDLVQQHRTKTRNKRRINKNSGAVETIRMPMKRYNDKAGKELREWMKLKHQLYAKDPKKMQFYQENSVLDMSKKNQYMNQQRSSYSMDKFVRKRSRLGADAN